jgi:hypothetical protein
MKTDSLKALGLRKKGLGRKAPLPALPGWLGDASAGAYDPTPKAYDPTPRAYGPRPKAYGLRPMAYGLRPMVSLGMTLVELLVAFVVLLMLVGALVSLTTQSLQTWTAGESRKEIYDRAMTVLDAITSDLRNTYVENEVFDDGQKLLQPPAFACDLDRNKNQRLRFVRTGTPATMRVPAGGAGGGGPNNLTVAPVFYTPAWEIAYVMDPEPGGAVLWRGVRGFDRKGTGSLLRPPLHYSAADPGFTDRFARVESGVLWVGYKFWTQFTTTWDDAVGIQKVGPSSRQKSGPERRWDSTRREDKGFFFYRKYLDPKNPDFVVPEIVEVTVVVEAGTPDAHGVRLAEACDERASAVRLTHTRGLPDAPGMVRIEGEWIEYGGITLTELTNVRRAQRLTAAAHHPAGTPVRFGETFTTEVRLSVYREAQEP